MPEDDQKNEIEELRSRLAKLEAKNLNEEGVNNLKKSDIQDKKGQPNKVAIGCVTIFLILIFLVFIAHCATGSDSSSSDNSLSNSTTGENSVPAANNPDKPQEAPISAPERMSVTAVQLGSAYSANEVAAEQKYGDRPISVSGVIDEISLTMGDATVRLSADDNIVTAFLRPEEKSTVATLAKGQEIILNCDKATSVVGVALYGCALAAKQ